MRESFAADPRGFAVKEGFLFHPLHLSPRHRNEKIHKGITGTFFFIHLPPRLFGAVFLLTAPYSHLQENRLFASAIQNEFNHLGPDCVKHYFYVISVF